jgi:prophage antirepressor-like protein
MTEYQLDKFGKFNNTEILSIVDRAGRHWFTQEIVASALDVDRTTLTYIRQNHPGEFTDGMEYSSIVFEGKRRIVYSEEGFLTICDMSTSEVAFRLRRWMRHQFRVKHQSGAIAVNASPLLQANDSGEQVRLVQRL